MNATDEFVATIPDDYPSIVLDRDLVPIVPEDATIQAVKFVPFTAALEKAIDTRYTLILPRYGLSDCVLTHAQIARENAKRLLRA